MGTADWDNECKECLRGENHWSKGVSRGGAREPEQDGSIV